MPLGSLLTLARMEARVLGPAIVREICFRVLMGEQGAAMRAAGS